MSGLEHFSTLLRLQSDGVGGLKNTKLPESDFGKTGADNELCVCV